MFTETMFFSTKIVFGFFFMLYVASRFLKNNSIVDTAWGAGFVIVVWCNFLFSGYRGLRHIAVLVLVTLWGLRLAYHIAKRNAGKPEDFRYAQWRLEWGRWEPVRSFFQVYMLQGFFMLIISLPVIMVFSEPFGEPLLTDFIGPAVWLAGYVFETVGDRQLAVFLADAANKGKIMDKGLWRYTRHPNYFGESVMWWGIGIIGLGIYRGWMGLVSPLTITWLLVFVSGVPLLEKSFEGNEEFRKYAERTSVFIPLPPRKEKKDGKD